MFTKHELGLNLWREVGRQSALPIAQQTAHRGAGLYIALFYEDIETIEPIITGLGSTKGQLQSCRDHFLVAELVQPDHRLLCCCAVFMFLCFYLFIYNESSPPRRETIKTQS